MEEIRDSRDVEAERGDSDSEKAHRSDEEYSSDDEVTATDTFHKLQTEIRNITFVDNVNMTK